MRFNHISRNWPQTRGRDGTSEIFTKDGRHAAWDEEAATLGCAVIGLALAMYSASLRHATLFMCVRVPRKVPNHEEVARPLSTHNSSLLTNMDRVENCCVDLRDLVINCSWFRASHRCQDWVHQAQAWRTPIQASEMSSHQPDRRDTN